MQSLNTIVKDDVVVFLDVDAELLFEIDVDMLRISRCN